MTMEGVDVDDLICKILSFHVESYIPLQTGVEFVRRLTRLTLVKELGSGKIFKNQHEIIPFVFRFAEFRVEFS